MTRAAWTNSGEVVRKGHISQCSTGNICCPGTQRESSLSLPDSIACVDSTAIESESIRINAYQQNQIDAAVYRRTDYHRAYYRANAAKRRKEASRRRLGVTWTRWLLEELRHIGFLQRPPISVRPIPVGLVRETIGPFLLRHPDWAERIRASIEIDAATGCWIWTARKNRKGYGLFSLGPKSTSAHRASYACFRGDVGKSLVCHTCDTPGCVYPGHLFLGSHKENMQDAKLKGRLQRRHVPDSSETDIT